MNDAFSPLYMMTPKSTAIIHKSKSRARNYPNHFSTSKFKSSAATALSFNNDLNSMLGTNNDRKKGIDEQHMIISSFSPSN